MKHQPTPTPETATEQITTLPRGKREISRFKKRFPGIVTDVAEKTGKRVSTVSHVLNGRDASAKITAAILREANRRIQAEQFKEDAA